MRRTLLALCLILGCLCPLHSQTKATISADLAARATTCPYPQQAIAMATDEATREALTFLYAYMSYPDMTDYSPAYYVAQAAAAVRARGEMAWGKSVPEREWLHFVLPVRINNENLDTFRTTCYEELKARVQGLSMHDAALEVNHWCHEKVTYKPSDSRTSSPLASMRTAYGRCGEESTFTVSALRTVGIPARQVYTPRWAHTDDNHAWVEVWIDGQWHFLGACEPEAVLDLGWFNQPASRGMLMHTKVYGRYDGPEDIIDQTPCYTEINVTSNYASTTRTRVQVVDERGRGVAGATVEYKIYNYAEFYTVYRTTSDDAGYSSIQTGLGDCIVWASTDKAYGFTAFSAGDADVRVTLNRHSGDRYAIDLNLTPPVGHNNLPKVSPEDAAANEVRKAREDSIRTAYVSTFPTREAIAADCAAWGYTADEVWPLVEASRGNHAALLRLLRTYRDRGESLLRVLRAMSAKDIRDFDYDIVASHIEAAALPAQISDFEARYIYCPRIATEGLTPWRAHIKADCPVKPNATARDIATWIRRHISDDCTYNPVDLYQAPSSILRMGTATLRNRGLLFVAICRTLGIPARIDEVTGKVQYATQENTPWQSVDVGGQATKTNEQTGALRLAYTPTEHLANPNYYSHFSLSCITEGREHLLEYAEGGSTWQDFKDATPIDEGDYILVSGTRMDDGSVLTHVEVFPVKAGQTTEIPLVMRQDESGVQVIGNFNAENRYFDLTAAEEKSLISTTGRGHYVLGIIRANHEPSNHILHDISLLSEDLEAWGRPILMLFASEEEYQRFQQNSSEYQHLPATLRFGIDTTGEVCRDLFGSGLTKSDELPAVIIADTFNRVTFLSQGYTIGLGERLKQTIGKLTK